MKMNKAQRTKRLIAKVIENDKDLNIVSNVGNDGFIWEFSDGSKLSIREVLK